MLGGACVADSVHHGLAAIVGTALGDLGQDARDAALERCHGLQRLLFLALVLGRLALGVFDLVLEVLENVDVLRLCGGGDLHGLRFFSSSSSTSSAS